LANYDQALELYGRLPQISAGVYQVHLGKLSCFKQTNDGARFGDELKVVMQQIEDYRQNIREDSSRQAFFDSQQKFLTRQSKTQSVRAMSASPSSWSKIRKHVHSCNLSNRQNPLPKWKASSLPWPVP